MHKLFNKWGLKKLTSLLCFAVMVTVFLLGTETVKAESYEELLRQLPYNKVTFLGTHNSAANTSPNSLATLDFIYTNANQHLSLTEQLDAGVRVFDLDFELFMGNVHLVHGTSGLGFTNARTAMAVIKQWMLDNPNEILTINCSDKKLFNGSFNEKIKNEFLESGLDSLVYSYNENRQPNDSWPTLQQMIDSGKRVMVSGLENSAMGFHDHQSFFKYPGQDPVNGWKAKEPRDLGADKAWIDYSYNEANRLFVLNMQVSRRNILKDMPYITAGNPIQSDEVNNFKHAYNLAKEFEIQLDSLNQNVNYIIVDYLTATSEVINVVRQLNMERLGLSGAVKHNLSMHNTSTTNSEETRHRNYVFYGNDISNNTRYCATNSDTGYWWQVDFGRVCQLSDMAITFEFDGRKYDYLVQRSTDGRNWYTIKDLRNNPLRSKYQYFNISGNARYVRITSTGLQNRTSFSFYNVDVNGYRQ